MNRAGAGSLQGQCDRSGLVRNELVGLLGPDGESLALASEEHHSVGARLLPDDRGRDVVGAGCRVPQTGRLAGPGGPALGRHLVARDAFRALAAGAVFAASVADFEFLHRDVLDRTHVLHRGSLDRLFRHGARRSRRNPWGHGVGDVLLGEVGEGAGGGVDDGARPNRKAAGRVDQHVTVLVAEVEVPRDGHDGLTRRGAVADVPVQPGVGAVVFRQLQLPRSVHVAYPRSTNRLLEEASQGDDTLAAVLAGELVGYIRLRLNIAPLTAWATDLAVKRRYRKQGIGSGLVLAGQDWGRQQGSHRMVLEMQPKNYPAICLAQKLGFDLCGYNDRYYPNHDIALFFAKTIR